MVLNIRCVAYRDDDTEQSFEVASLDEVTKHIDESVHEVVDCAGS